MVSPVKEASARPNASSQDTADATLAELRASVAAIAKEIAALAEHRARVAGETTAKAAEAGIAQLQSSIRQQPVVAVGIAAAAGALLALAILPRSRRAPRSDRWASNITRAELYELADNLQRSVSRAATAAAAPVTPAFERMVEALSSTDTSSLSSIVDKLGGWLRKAQEKPKQKS